MKNILKFSYAFAVTFLCAYIAGIFTHKGLNAWYYSIEKPAFVPPDFVFSIVWVILYPIMAISFGIALMKSPFHEQRLLNILYLGQLFLQVLWCYIFFTQGWFGIALIVILLLVVTVFRIIQNFYRNSIVAARLMYPYFWWLVFASFLNYAFIAMYGTIIAAN